MKKLRLILILTILLKTSILLSQNYNLLKWGLGFGGGTGDGGPNFSMIMTMELQDKNKFFMNIGGTGIFTGKNENNTYDFNENLFDDVTRDILKTYAWVTLGYVMQWKNLDFHLGGGFSGYSKYYEKYDPTEILSSNGTYYVYDEESGGNYSLTPSLGIVLYPEGRKLDRSGLMWFEGIGFSIVQIPLQSSFTIWFGFG